MIANLILAFFIARYFHRNVQTSFTPMEWNKLFTAAWVFIVFMFVTGVSFHRSGTLILWLSWLLVLFLVSLPFWRTEFSQAKSVIFSVIPFVIVSLVGDTMKLVAINLYNSSLKGFIDAGTFFSVVWMIVMWIITNRQKKALTKERLIREAEEKQNKITAALKDQLEVQVAERTVELTQQKEELQHTLDELRSTQVQLIQREKMASLGELAAGIAHEIQNPLNFVNNFSELSVELAEELKEELNKIPISPDEKENLEALTNDLVQNQEKINHHGKRADAIIKGMLQHSRSSTGIKELTDLNTLTDEYLRLSYHGLRAKDKLFNATIKTDFDKALDADKSPGRKINIIPGDIGRVLLNLFNNAFYAVTEKKKEQGELFEPTVWVSTKRLDDKVEITVKDNGMGIPQKTMGKIFQPFFTTKPTGQGTGLGLSLSYDIVTKGHGGELKVEAKEGEGAEFIIQLPFYKQNVAEA